jgi:hypothetical protein
LKLSAIPRIFFVASFLFLSQISFSQIQPAGGGQKVVELPTTWDVFMGGSLARASSQNTYGWDAAVSEYPYKSYPWVGGTIDASGHYYNKSGASSQLYAVMGGPSVVLRSRRLQPFARFMLGGVINRYSATVGSVTTTASSDHFGLSVGGGVDVPLGSRCAIRGQGDWVPYWVKSQVQTQRQDVLRVSGGIVFRF